MNLSMRIGEVAQLTGLDVRLIRHYEKIGLIPPPRRREAGYAQAGYRLFTEEHVQRLRFIRLCRLLDLPLREIGELLSCVDEGCCASAQPGLGHSLEAKLQEVDRRLALLRGLRRRLKSYRERLQGRVEDRESAACKPGASPRECAFGTAGQRTTPDKRPEVVADGLTLQRLEQLDCNRSMLPQRRPGCARAVESRAKPSRR